MEQRAVPSWPTCLAFGPCGELYVSQYRVRGLLQFSRCPDGYQYQRTVAAGPRFGSPEGVVCCHGTLYLVSTDRGTITRLSPAGKVLEETAPFVNDADPDEEFVYWGMCRGPYGHLYIAAHVSDENDYLQPTARDTGGVLCQRLSATGEFLGPTLCAAGYPDLCVCKPNAGTPVGQHFVAYNRPSDPAFCGHGMLHISSFVTAGSAGREQLAQAGARRAVYKILVGRRLTDDLIPSVRSQCRGWLEAADGLALLRHPWGVSFAAAPGSQADGQTLLCCQSAEDDEGSPVVQLPSCGCLAMRDRTNPWLLVFHTRGLSCGAATALGGAAAGIRKANYITHVESGEGCVKP